MWQRPSGPPHVWRVIELVDANGKMRKFSMQEIPVDRYDEVLQHMNNYFIRDENLCATLNVKDDRESINQLREIWRKILNQGITVGAFEIIDNIDEPILAGLNILFYGNDEIDGIFKSIGAEETKAAMMVKFSMDACANADPRKLYNVDNYLGALGLSVDPKYRGIGLAKHILKARDDIGEAYGIKYTTTIFSSPAAQKSAANAGFKVQHECIFDEKTKAAMMVKFAMDACANVDPRKLYHVDYYLGALGLSVDPEYRGLELSKHLVKARDDIAKAYNIKYTTTIFLSKAAQKSAGNSGFEVQHECVFHDKVHCKIMGKTYLLN